MFFKSNRPQVEPIDHGRMAGLLATLPLAARRHLLRVVWLARAATGRIDLARLRDLMRASLRLSDREAARAERGYAFFDELNQLEWLALATRSRNQLVRDSARISIDDPDTLQRAANSGKSIVLAPIHMGNYVGALAAIMHRHFPERPLLILRARDDRTLDNHVMQRIAEIGIDLRFLKVSDKADYLAAARFARHGAVIVYFVDLPSSYGNPVDVTLFGHPARLAFSIDTFTRLIGATVIPLAATSSLSGDAVHIGKPFEVIGGSATERSRVLARIVSHIQNSIIRMPAQWHMWPRFAEFAVTSQTES